MDYQGQLLCERVNQAINIAAGVIGFAYGWWIQSFWMTFLFVCGGFVLSCIACLPDWPFYNRHPLPWQPAEVLPGSKDPSGATVEDTNIHCGTCSCGTTIHGINCEMHPRNKDRKAENATGDAAPTNTTAANVEIQEIKVRSTKKK